MYMAQEINKIAGNIATNKGMQLAAKRDDYKRLIYRMLALKFKRCEA